MQLLILGATGPTGKHLVRQALAKFHHVTALVRDPTKLSLSHENLTIIKGDVLDETTLTNSLKGMDAVLSALGRGKSFKSSDLMVSAVTNLIPGMKATNVKRLVFLSAFGVGETFAQANFIQRLIFRTLLKNIYSDKAKADTMLCQSSLDWILIYPVLLTDDLITNKYKVGEKLPMKGMPKISRADVAEFMLQQLTDDSYLRKIAVIMS